MLRWQYTLCKAGDSVSLNFKARRVDIRRLFTVAIAAVFAFTCALPASAASPPNPTAASAASAPTSEPMPEPAVEPVASPTSGRDSRVVRVAFPHQVGLTEVDENGRYTGYTYEYLMEIAQYTGWEYEFVTPKSKNIDEGLNEMLELLESGELDIIGGIRKTPATEKLYDLSAYHYGTSSVTLSALQTNTEISPANYYSRKGLRIAVLEGATQQNALLEQFCSINHFSPTLVYANNEAEQLALMHDGNVDLMLGRDISPIAGMRTIAKFSPEPFFFAVTKNNPEMLGQLNYALLSIETLNPKFSATSFNKYFTPATSVGLLLSDNEREFIRGSGPIKVGLVPHRDPMQHLDPATGKASGIMVDLLNEISKRTGLLFSYESADSLTEFEQSVAAGRFALVSGMDYSYDLAKDYGVIMTAPVLSVPYVRVASSSAAPATARLGFTQQMQHLDEIVSKTPDAIFYPTGIEALEAVLRGEIAAAYMDSYGAQRLLSDRKFKTLALAPAPQGEQAQICIGVSRTYDRTLSSIISKAVYSLSPQDISAVVYKNTTALHTMTLWRMVTLYPAQSILFTSVFLLLVILFLFFVLRRTTRLKNALASNNRRYIQLCELVRELVCEYDYAADTLTVVGTNDNWLFSKPAYKNFLRERTPTDPERVTIEQILTRLILDRSSGEINHLCMLPNTDQRWVCINHHVSMNDNGSPDFFICKITDVSENMLALEKLTVKAQTDTLTRLYNLDAFRTLVNDTLSAEGEPISGTLLIMDIDHFKGINDSYGHYEGDEVLKGVADALRAAFRESDFAARLGGDEFLAFSPGLTNNDLIAAKCRDVMTRCGRISERFTVTLSLGAVHFRTRTNFDELYKVADVGLYRAKAAGRNGYDISEL